MPQRFYLPELTETGRATLDGTEAHHLIHVMRAKVGDVVELFNGLGLVAKAEVTKLGRRDAELQVLEARRDAPMTRQIVLGTAIPKGDRIDWLIEKATELGVTRIIPLVTARSVVDPREGKLEKLRQTVIAACKQSGRNHLLELSPVMSWSDFCKREMQPESTFVAHPSPGASLFSTSLLSGKTTLVVAVGPEGGFSEDEISLAVSHGAKPVHLGRLILRIETAALALAAVSMSSPEHGSS